jgi:hypothetical protein
MDLFFKRDCVGGAGPAVELARPALLASLPAVALEVPAVALDVPAVAVVEVEGWPEVVVAPLPRLNIAGAGALVEVAAEPFVVPLPPPLVAEKRGGAVVPDDPAVVVVAPDVAVVPAEAGAVVLAKLNPFPSGGCTLGTPLNRPPVGAEVDAGGLLAPEPKLAGFGVSDPIGVG